MKKIGILTFHRAKNYGAVLQAFALEQFLLKIGFDVEIIDYRCKHIENMYKPFKKKKGNLLKNIIRDIIFYKNMNEKDRKFNKFIDENLLLSENYDKSSELELINDKYDYFIVGSDQVWNPTASNFDQVYFLNFAKAGKKMSYAASIGKAFISQEVEMKIKNLLKNYSYISIRESNTKNLIEKMVEDIPISINVDPTLLLKKSEWSEITNNNRNDKYVLVYNVEKCIDDLKFAMNIAQKKNLPLYYINDRTIIKNKKITYIESPSPIEFLELFKNAEYIVTNSFHGTVFSIIFQRKFFVEIENVKNRNIRAENLLNLFNLGNRVINNSNLDIDEIILWDDIEKIQKNEIDKTVKYFNNIKK